MRYYDDYQDLYNSDEEWYYTYVDEQLKKIKRRYDKNERKRTQQRNN